MEAWRPQDKSNLDWAHPWCASPSFTIPGSVLGVWPLEPGWTRWQLAPQPSSVDAITAAIPTPAGLLSVVYVASVTAAQSNSTVSLTVLEGQSAQVCLAAPGNATSSEKALSLAASDLLYVDGSPVAAQARGRLSCTTSDIGSGTHTVSRVLTTEDRASN